MTIHVHFDRRRNTLIEKDGTTLKLSHDELLQIINAIDARKWLGVVINPTIPAPTRTGYRACPSMFRECLQHAWDHAQQDLDDIDHVWQVQLSRWK